ncbi:MAG: LytR/AlgR family response regulator transcription factor [Geodermatophilaceae bacterium]
MRVLAVDDEPPALDELAFLLRSHPAVSEVITANNASDALRAMQEGGPHEIGFDVVFLDIRMPGLDGLELGKVLVNFARPPAVVFVTAHDDRAVDAYDLGAVDYLLKPVRADRLDESLRRVQLVRDAVSPAPEDEVIPVELAGITTMLARSSVRWVEAQGDYARLHTKEDSHLVRIPLSTLEDRWSEAGFVRIHRSYLVALRLITQLRLTPSGYVVIVDEHELPVSRRHTRALKDRLVRTAKAGWTR